MKSGDPNRFAHAVTERDRHTCHLLVDNYTVKFHRIGIRKWLSDQTPEGPCQVVDVWELSSDDEDGLIWKVRSTTVAVGNTKGLCAVVAEALKEVGEWNMANPKEYEPCDFIAFE